MLDIEICFVAIVLIAIAYILFERGNYWKDRAEHYQREGEYMRKAYRTTVRVLGDK